MYDNDNVRRYIIKYAQVNGMSEVPYHPLRGFQARSTSAPRPDNMIIDLFGTSPRPARTHPFHKYFPIKLLFVLKNAMSPILRISDPGRFIQSSGTRRHHSYTRARQGHTEWNEVQSATGRTVRITRNGYIYWASLFRYNQGVGK